MTKNLSHEAVNCNVEWNVANKKSAVTQEEGNSSTVHQTKHALPDDLFTYFLIKSVNLNVCRALTDYQSRPRTNQNSSMPDFLF